MKTRRDGVAGDVVGRLVLPVEGSSAGAGRRASRKKLRPPGAAGAPPAREVVRTAEERARELPEVPSLASPLPEEEIAALISPEAGPPAAPPPAPEPAPGQYLDRGAPVPESYGMDRVVALPRDPQWVFVYWELSGGTLERLRGQYGLSRSEKARWALRVRALHEGAGEYLVEVDLAAGQWYLRTERDTRLSVELGFLGAGGEFVCVVRSNQTHTPRPSTSEVMDERWVIARPDLDQFLRAAVWRSSADCPVEAAGGSEGGPRLAWSAPARSEQPRAAALFSGYLARTKKE